KRATKKSSSTPTTDIVIREPPVTTKTKGKGKEKVDVAHGKGIELLSDVSLTDKALMKEVRKKSLRDFHKTHPGGSGTTAKEPPSVEKTTPTVTSKGTGDKPRVPDVTYDDSTKSKSKSWGNNEDDSNHEDRKTDNEGSEKENASDEHESDSEQDDDDDDDDDDQENKESDQEKESEDDKTKSDEGDEDQGMDDTTEQFDDDVDTRLEEQTETATGTVQGKGTNVEITEVQQGDENLETAQEQVVEDAHVTISIVPKKTEVPVTSSSHSSDLETKYLNFSDIPHTDAEIVSPLDVPVHHEVPRTQAPTLLTIPVSVIPESSPVFRNIPQSSYTFTLTPIQTTPTPPPTIETTNPLSNLPDFASVFRFNDRITALEKDVAELKKDPLHTKVTSLVDKSCDEVTLAKVSSQPQSTYEAASTLTELVLKKFFLDKMEIMCEKDKDKMKDPFRGIDRGLKKRKTSKDAEPTTGQKKKDSTSGSSKSQLKSSGKSIQSEEPVFEVADSDLPQDQEGNLGDNEDEPRNETASRRDWFKKPTPPQEPTDPDWNIGKTIRKGPTPKLVDGR
ncbi:hypothetical protein Tco_0519964, partial [Tanacetum coccineum]